MKSYIWSLPTRVFHWLFALLILLAFLTEDDDFLNYHALIGYAILILLGFRFFWGYLGPKYSKFKDFPMSIGEVKEFVANIFKGEQKYVGHNPLASYVMIAIFAVSFLAVITGVLTLGIQEGKGILSSLNSTFFKDMELFEEIHEFLSSVLIALIVMHLLGVLSERLLHSKHKTFESIFSGYKVTKEQEGIKLNIFQKLLAALFLALLVAFLFFSLTTSSNPLIASKYVPLDYRAQNELFVDECASCHTLYPPHTLSAKSWNILMADLQNHFGDDASIDKMDNRNILNFLLNNSAENSTQEVSVKILNSIKNKDIIAITQTDFWKAKHGEIPKKVFAHESVKSRANCKACHSDIEKGLIEDENIKNINAYM